MITKKQVIGVMIAIALIGIVAMTSADLYEEYWDGNQRFIQINNVFSSELNFYLQNMEGVASLKVVDDEVTLLQFTEKVTYRQESKIRRTLKAFETITDQNRARITGSISGKLPMCMWDGLLQVPVGYYSSGGKMLPVVNDTRCYN